MRVLLDTNILIYREDDLVISESIQELMRIFPKIKVELLIHPLSMKELRRDRDLSRREIMLSKIKAYPLLESPPDPRNDYKYLAIVSREICETKELSIDNAILYSIFKDAVDFLITEDVGIHRKANKLGIADRVLNINDALQIFKGFLLNEQIISPPALKHEFVYNLNLQDSFFDSLKEDFEKWFKKAQREGRKCWVHLRRDHSIGPLLIYKFEDESIDSTPSLPKRKRLKISTFKVTHEGHKIGELFIKLSVELAIENEISEIYLTHFMKSDDRLAELISEYGFEKAACTRSGEEIFLKRVLVETEAERGLPPIEISRRFYPSFYDGTFVKKFIVPIQPQYHNRLFTDFKGRQTTLNEHSGEFIVEGNTIEKAYICHSKIRRIEQGDIILFYLSQRQRLTSIGVVQVVYQGVQDSDVIIRLVGRRTVYSRVEIEEMSKKPATVILFRHHFHFKNPLSFRELKSKGVLLGSPQSIVEITTDRYIWVKQKGSLDERFTVH